MTSKLLLCSYFCYYSIIFFVCSLYSGGSSRPVSSYAPSADLKDMAARAGTIRDWEEEEEEDSDDDDNDDDEEEYQSDSSQSSAIVHWRLYMCNKKNIFIVMLRKR